MNIITTEQFDKWLGNLKDEKGKTSVLRRIYNIRKNDYFGDVKSISNDIKELRIRTGPGYRVYFYCIIIKNEVYLLCGGGKSTQVRDIKKAIIILDDIKKQYE